MPATAFYEAARKLGRRIPEEFSVVAYDGTYAVDMTDSSMTTVVQQLEHISREVVRMVLRLLRKEKNDTEGVFVPVLLRKGSTT